MKRGSKILFFLLLVLALARGFIIGLNRIPECPKHWEPQKGSLEEENYVCEDTGKVEGSVWYRSNGDWEADVPNSLAGYETFGSKEHDRAKRYVEKHTRSWWRF